MPSSPWQCMLAIYLSFPSLMPVQAPGIRPSDVLHKNSAAVQGVEVLRGVYAVYSLAMRICFAFLGLLRLPQRVLHKYIRTDYIQWQMPSNHMVRHTLQEKNEQWSVAWIYIEINGLPKELILQPYVCLGYVRLIYVQPCGSFHSSMSAITMSFKIEPQDAKGLMRRCGNGSFSSDHDHFTSTCYSKRSCVWRCSRIRS